MAGTSASTSYRVNSRESSVNAPTQPGPVKGVSVRGGVPLGLSTPILVREDYVMCATDEKKDGGDSSVTAAPVSSGMMASRMSRGAVGKAPSVPPRLMVTLNGTHTVRFSGGNGSAIPVTVADLLGAFGAICTVTGTTAVALMSSVKMHSIQIWSAASSSASTTASVSWAAGESSQVPDESIDDSFPQGTTVVGGVSFRPPAMSLAALWITSADASATLFSITSSAGSIVDVRCSFRVCDTITPLAISISVGTVGKIYYLALDGPSSNVYKPTSLPTTH